MFILIEIVENATKVDIFFCIKDVEREMKQRYNRRVQTAKSIDWSNTWFDWEKKIAKVDNWEKIVEYRVGIAKVA